MSVSAAASLSPLYAARNATGRPLTAEDIWKLRRVGAPIPSPVENWLAVPVTAYDLETNEGRARLWRVPSDGGEPRPLTAADVSANEPAFSPDGKRLAFTRKRNTKDKPQLCVLPLDGGEAEPLTDFPLGVFDPTWLPDGKRIVFAAMMCREAPSIEGSRTRLAEREKSQVKAYVTEDRVFRFWDRWLVDGEVPHLFVIDVETRAVRDLTPESNRWFDFMEPSGQYDVSPDGAEIVFSASVNDPGDYLLRWALFTVPVAGGPVTCLTPKNSADDVQPRYTPDGRWIVYGRQEDPFFYADRVRLVRRDRRTGEETELAAGWDRSPSQWEFLDAQTLLVAAEDRARTGLFRLPLAGGMPTAIHTEGVAGSARRGHDGRVYFIHQSLSQPAEIASVALDGSDRRAVTRFNAELMKDVAFGEVHEMEFAGAGGQPVQAFVVYPPGFDPAKKYPLLQVIHGGPHGTTGDQFHFRWNPQLFAAPGYVVACVNFHGSTSWGQEFAQCIQGAHGDRPFTDVMRATDALAGLDFVDENRMGALGGSYGGYLVSWIAGHTDRFRCLVNHAGVYDTLAQYASDVTQGRHRSYGGEPWSGLDNIDRWNPARFADGFNTPMLVIHGERDYRVPVTQGLSIYGVLKAKQVPARLVYFPDENHWVLKPQNSLLWYREVNDWLKRFLG
jgi:dipeptidyl aminopeptidase/acylaminoacyl peptidase